jgi:dihydrolipoamide dehydrogenase
MSGVYAVGDLTGEPMLAHRAVAQGRLAAEVIAGQRRTWDKMGIPAVVFTDPEIVSIGLNPDEAKRNGLAIVTGQFPYSASGRALSMADTDGFVRVVARESDHLVIGMQGVGAGISELSTPFALALEMGARLEDIADTIHAHPTRGEAMQEAALQALGIPMHLVST